MGTDSDNTERATSPTSVAPLEAGSEGKTTEPIGPPLVPPPLRQLLNEHLRAYDRASPSTIERQTRSFLRWYPFVRRARAILPLSARFEELADALIIVGVAPKHLRVASYIYRALYRSDKLLIGASDHRKRMEPRSQVAVRAMPGKPGYLGIDYFRSTWEERLAKSLDRLAIKWTYEPEWFGWYDRHGRQHRYTPDFCLDDLSNVYVEVKGHDGADQQDSWKMSRVLKNYPDLTLLLWDAGTIEYIEDLTDPSMVLALLRTTKLAA